MAKTVIAFGRSDTGKTISDITWDFCKKISDGGSIYTSDATLIELGKGMYVLEMPNVTSSAFPELITGGDFSSVGSWIVSAPWRIESGVAIASGGNGSMYFPNILTTGKSYTISAQVLSVSGTGFLFGAGYAGTGTYKTTPGTYSEILTAVGSGCHFESKDSGTSGIIDNASCREANYNEDVAFSLYLTSDPSKYVEGVFSPTDGDLARNSTLSAVSAGTNSMSADMELIQQDISTINAATNSISANQDTITGNIGTITIDIGDIDSATASISANQDAITQDIQTIMSSTMSISANQDTITQDIGTIDQTIVFIQDDISTINDSISGIDASTSSISGDITQIQLDIADLADEAFGKWDIDPVTHVMTLYRRTGEAFCTFDLTKYNGVISSYRTRTPR